MSVFKTLTNRLVQKINSLKTVEENYKFNKKGRIYYETVHQHKKAIQFLKKEIKDYGKGKIISYRITHHEVGSPLMASETIYLDSSISIKDIHRYYKVVLNREVYALVEKDKITLGFNP
jgi:hypothetical protein